MFEEYKRADPLEWAAKSPIGHSFPPTKRQIFPLISVATNIAAFPSHGRFVDRPGIQRFIVVFYNFSTRMDGWADGQQNAVEATTRLDHCTVWGCFFDEEVFLFTLYVKTARHLGHSFFFFQKTGVTWNLHCLEKNRNQKVSKTKDLDMVKNFFCDAPLFSGYLKIAPA